MKVGNLSKKEENWKFKKSRIPEEYWILIILLKPRRSNDGI
jgi:hypothetical protein